MYESLMNAKIIHRDKQCVTTEELYEDYDLYLNYLRGGPGFGDPLERDPKKVEQDLNEGHVLPRYAESVYGAVFTQQDDGTYVVDVQRTQERRDQMRKERLKRGIPTKQWMERERKKILNKEASLQVLHMYAGSFALSKKFTEEFKAFWNLPEDWMLYEDELDMPIYGAHRAWYRKDDKRLNIEGHTEVLGYGEVRTENH